ncbi:MAG: biotin--[acetyl-CoA-carboxylase] ligase [Gallionella sp.]|nr:biotin--[acetyl-CoA-carboxylase] ligase [Gallionella sp.]
MNLSPRCWQLLTILSDGKFHAGTDLARTLNVSRATISNDLKSAVQFGIALQRIRGRGYRLSQAWQPLNAAQIVTALGDTASRLSLDIQLQNASSNLALLQQMSVGAPSGSVLAVEFQTSGRGRAGRTWHSGLGNALTFSLLWRFEGGFNRLAGLSLAVGVAVLRGLRASGIEGAQLKWPNDILSPEGGKLGGILIEARGEISGACAVVIGIGLNCTLPANLAQRIDQPAAALDQLNHNVIDHNLLLAQILQQLVSVLDEFSTAGFAPFHAEWEHHHAQQNQSIQLKMPDGSLCHGIARGVNAQGELCLETPQGMQCHHSGEIAVSQL